MAVSDPSPARSMQHSSSCSRQGFWVSLKVSYTWLVFLHRPGPTGVLLEQAAATTTQLTIARMHVSRHGNASSPAQPDL